LSCKVKCGKNSSDWPAVPWLIYQVRDPLLRQIRLTSKLIFDCANCAPALTRSLYALVHLYLMALRKHGQQEGASAFPVITEETDKSRKELALAQFLSCDPEAARRLAEEFEVSNILVKLCLENSDEDGSQELIREYACQYPLFLEHLFLCLTEQSRLGDVLDAASYCEGGFKALRAFLECCKNPGNGCTELKEKIQRLEWLLNVMEEQNFDSASSTLKDLATAPPEDVKDTVHSLGLSSASSKRRRMHAALGFLSRYAWNASVQDDITHAAQAELRKQDVVQMYAFSSSFSPGACGIGNYEVSDGSSQQNPEYHQKIIQGVLEESEIAKQCIENVIGQYNQIGGCDMRDGVHDAKLEQLATLACNNLQIALETLDLQINSETLLRATQKHRTEQDPTGIIGLKQSDVPESKNLTARCEVWRCAITLNTDVWRDPRCEAFSAQQSLVFLKLAEQWLLYIFRQSGQRLEYVKNEYILLKELVKPSVSQELLIDVPYDYNDIEGRNVESKLLQLWHQLCPPDFR